MKIVERVKIVRLNFNKTYPENNAFLGNFTTMKRAAKHMKKLTKKFNKRDKSDPWNIPLENTKDYIFSKGIVSKKEYNRLRKKGR